MDSQASQSTVDDTVHDDSEPALPDLSRLSPIFVLTTHLASDKLHVAEESLSRRGAPLTYDVREARIFIGNITQKRRAIFELRALKVKAEEVVHPAPTSKSSTSRSEPARKKQKLDQSSECKVITIDDSSTESEPDADVDSKVKQGRRRQDQDIANDQQSTDIEQTLSVPGDQVIVLKLSWLEDSVKAGLPKPFDGYMLFSGRRAASTSTSATPKSSAVPPASSSSEAPTSTLSPQSQSSILARARAELGPDRGQSPAAWASSSQGRYTSNPATSQRSHHPSSHIPALLHQTTSEHDIHASQPPDLPPLPEWAIRRSTYSCERATPVNPPNAAFIAQLKIIRLARTLTGDEIGVRAYSTSIAAIAAYPHSITSPKEIIRLPGCDHKIAALWSEWAAKNRTGHSSSSSPDPTSGSEERRPGNNAAAPQPGATQDDDTPTGTLITAAAEAQHDSHLRVLRLFHDIWGVGALTARDFYSNGWRDLDDVVEFGWSGLSRVQQIGVKYYDEFLRKIPREEVESIVERIVEATRRVCGGRAVGALPELSRGVEEEKRAARRVGSDGVRYCIVGGYRRGKSASGDVDVIISHVDESQTLHLIESIVAELVEEGWITHELSTTTAGSRRGQATLPYRGAGGGHGFDTLDKALVVWQDPSFEGKEELVEQGLSREAVMKKNSNVHRRVDIIIAPWSKVGCAVLGWTAGTTFERDLRRYAKAVKGWKFDSSGVRERATGREVDLEKRVDGSRCETPEEAERMVFEGFGLVYREPWERCTG